MLEDGIALDEVISPESGALEEGREVVNAGSLGLTLKHVQWDAEGSHVFTFPQNLQILFLFSFKLEGVE